MSHLQPDDLSEDLPLGATQARYLALEQRAPGRPDSVIAVRWEVYGQTSSDAIEAALRAIIARHEVLRTRFADTPDGVKQQVLDTVEFRLGRVDIRALPIDDHEGRIDAIAREMAAKPFDLASPPLLRVNFVQQASDRAALLIAIHHAVFDGYSIGLLGHEIGEIAAAELTGGTPDLPELPLQMGDFALWQESCAASAARQEERRYWAETLADAPRFELSGDLSGGARAAARLDIRLPESFEARLSRAARRQNVSPFAFGAAATSAALASISSRPEATLAIPTSGRDEADLEPLIGAFVNTVPLRIRAAADATMADHLARTREALSGALAHQACPLAEIVAAAAPGEQAADTPFSSIGFGMQRVFLKERDYGPFRLISVPSHTPGILYDANFVFLGRAAGWDLIIDYDGARYSEARMRAYGEAILAAIDTLIDAPATPLAALPRDRGDVVPDSAPEQPDALAEEDLGTDAFADPMGADAARESAASPPTWDILTMCEGAPSGPVIVTINQPFLFYSIASCFAPDRTVINLAVPDRAAHERQREIGYEAIIDEAVELLSRSYPGRSLAFAGQCIDGMLALHIARRLEARGVRILPAALIDAWAPWRPETTPTPRLSKWRKTKQSLRRTQHYTLQKLRGRITWRDFASRSGLATRLLRAAGRRPAQSEGQRLLLDVNHHHQEVGRVHPFAPWDGEVLLFATDSQPRRAFRTMLNWKGVLAPDTPIFRVPGWHEDALLDQGYREVARVFDLRLSRALDRPSAVENPSAVEHP